LRAFADAHLPSVDITAHSSILALYISRQYVSVKKAFDLAVGTEITLRGWVRSRRDSKGITSSS
jgi:hypothetical protein